MNLALLLQAEIAGTLAVRFWAFWASWSSSHPEKILKDTPGDSR